MQPSAPSSVPPTPQKPPRRWLLRGVLLTLIVIGLFFLTLLPPFSSRLRETLGGSFLSLLPSFAQQNSPTVLPTNLPAITPASPTLRVAPTETVQPNFQTPTTPALLSTGSAVHEGWLVLSLLDRDDYHLFAYQMATQTWLRLSDGKGDDLYPAVSPDGRWIAFTSNREGYWDLYLLSLQDGRLYPLTQSPQYDGAPSWSPDGKWLAYESYVIDPQTQQGNLEIVIREINPPPGQAAQVLQLTSTSGADFAPQWSPMGRQIAFISQREGENDLWIADLDRMDDRYRNLSADHSSSVQALSWSLDGKELYWNAADEGVQWIYRWEANSPFTPSRKVVPGSSPILSDDGRVLFSVLLTPHSAYLQAFSLPDRTYPMPLILLPAEPKGMAWLPKGQSGQLLSAFQPLSNLEGLFPLQEASRSQKSQTPLRQRLKPLASIQAPLPYLHEDVVEAFQALRSAVEERAGWDMLSRLENAYLPLSKPSFPSSQEEWLYTGRAIALEPAALNAGWLVVVREPYGAEVYWRLYLKTRYQDGRQGMPLRELPFDLNARYSGDPIAYEEGGALMSVSPSGYWIDLTELAQRYGWERLPALTTWRTALSTSRYSILVKRDGLDWYSAMLELYPAEALYTPTPVPSPTQTPTRTPLPTRTATSAPTASPTLTPSIIQRPSQSPNPSTTP